MSVRSHVYNGTWQDGVDCVKPTKQPFREPKWPVQISSLLQIPVMRVRGKNHSTRVMHSVSTNQPVQVQGRCKSRVHRNGEESTDDSLCRQIHGHNFLDTHTSISSSVGDVSDYTTLPFPLPTKVHSPGRSQNEVTHHHTVSSILTAAKIFTNT